MSKQGRSIPEWCKSWGISRGTYYNLRKQGRAPAAMKVGSRRIISEEADARWRAEMEREQNDFPTSDAA